MLFTLDNKLSAQSLLGDESLNLWGLPKGLVFALNSAAIHILADVVLTLNESIHLTNLGGSLRGKSVGVITICAASDLLLALLLNCKENDSEVCAVDATTN